MTDALPGLLNPTRLLFDLQHVNDIAQRISGCLEPEVIARRITDGLVERFDCVFARIWIVEPDQATLRLVASSGLYTHTNGSFARVAIGAYKVGKIAQNRVPFLSNHLPDEPWVKDRDWAITNQIRGFAGYPLAVGDRVIGVLALFSHQTIAPGFLEVLQTLCMTATVALDAALSLQRSSISTVCPPAHTYPLSDQLAHLLPTRLTLVGTEQPLTPAMTTIFLKLAEILSDMACNYCRLTYSPHAVILDAIIAVPLNLTCTVHDWLQSRLGNLDRAAVCLNGTMQTQVGNHQNIMHVALTIPYTLRLDYSIQIQCSLPLLQSALTTLAYQAGLMVCHTATPHLLLTDQPDLIQALKACPSSLNPSAPDCRIVWIDHSHRPIPEGVAAVIDLRLSPEDFRDTIMQVVQGHTLDRRSLNPSDRHPGLSEREQKVMTLLAQGQRDREIAQQLHISESTVKFHINNALTKLKARNRYQAVYQATRNGWVREENPLSI